MAGAPFARDDDGSFAVLFEEIAQPALLVDAATGELVEANQAARDLLGYARGELAQLRASDIHPHELPALNAFLEQVAAEGRWERDDLACRTKGGRLVPARVRASYVRAFRRNCVLIVVQDLRLERLAELGQAVRKISHDLRNTLTNALMLAEGLAEQGDARVRKLAERQVGALERAADLCRRSLATGTAREPAPAPERLELDALAGAVADEVPSHDVAVANEVPAGLAAYADGRQLHRGLLNLARNAVQVSGTQRVAIQAVTLADGLGLDVVDDGPGLPEAVRAAVAAGGGDPGGAAPAAGERSGLGLAIAAELAANNDGRLTVAASDSAGTRMRLVLPAA